MDNTISVIRSRIARLREENEAMCVAREDALKAASDCEQSIIRNEAKIEALEEVLVVSRHAQREDGAQDSKLQLAHPTSSENGKPKPKATAAIFALIDKQGPTPRDQILELADAIDSDAGSKRHVLQTTLYNLTKRGKLAEDSAGCFDRPKKTAR
ncbi:MAG: hypothetical protein JW809_04775 [Pirellulales bacterium]|nr:hypothetical protein [Pirellulales bacterium]